MSKPLTLQLAEFVVHTPRSGISAMALERARMSLASTAASAAIGFGIESATIIRSLELNNGGADLATVWFTGTKLPLAAAVRVNAVASDAACRFRKLDPGVSVVQAA